MDWTGRLAAWWELLVAGVAAVAGSLATLNMASDALGPPQWWAFFVLGWPLLAIYNEK